MVSVRPESLKIGWSSERERQNFDEHGSMKVLGWLFDKSFDWWIMKFRTSDAGKASNIPIFEVIVDS